MIRYFEFRDAGKLPKAIPNDCAVCVEKDLYTKYNCDGEGNPDYKTKIGAMEFYQCPLSLVDQDAIDVINLVTTSMESGIPVHGHDLLGQTRAFFDYKRIIYSERADCAKELQQIREAETKREAPKTRSGFNKSAQQPRGPRLSR